jgi:menaquinol-cytochrome c reductase cytochrome b subunit
MPRLPAPPLPKILLPRPRRPGDNGDNGPMKPAEAAQEAGITVVDWLDERTSLSGGIRWALFRKVPRGINWFYTLGSATLFAFLSQAVTGVFLAMYYRPDAASAYESIRTINDKVFLGQFVHGMHKWGASVMIILIFLHMARVFFFGAYKYPRELTWVIGVTLLILTLMMGLTGYLLPLNNQAYWATVVATNIQAGGPFIGPYLANFLIGGSDFGATTLSRFYAIHMLLIPGAIVVLIGAHLYLVAKLGISAPPYLKVEEEPEIQPQAEV